MDGCKINDLVLIRDGNNPDNYLTGKVELVEHDIVTILVKTVDEDLKFYFDNNDEMVIIEFNPDQSWYWSIPIESLWENEIFSK